MSLKTKLNRLKPHLSTGSQMVKQEVPKQDGLEVPFLNDWEKAGVRPYFFDNSYCFIREVAYPLSAMHGKYQLREFLTAINIWNSQKVRHPLSSAGHLPDELFFFDTETTGLGGGTGNTIFLLGYASICGEKLILRQHILPHPGAEVPLYQSFLEKVNYKTLVTYNGKSFDWPQVKTRHTLVREHVPKLPEFGHFDLYHAARRLWKHKLERLKLSIVEKEVLGVERIDDLPGFLAPMIYFDFIENKRPDGLLGILKHNEIDILSLVVLYTHLTFQIHGIDQNRTRDETFEVGRWFAALGETKEAEQTLAKLADGNDIAGFKSNLTLAYQFKKQLNWERASSLFSKAADSNDDWIALEACFELAKIHEHRMKNYPLAIEYCERAMDLATKLKKTPKDISLEQLLFRHARLEKKAGKAQ